MIEAEISLFDSAKFLDNIGPGRVLVHRKAKEMFFAQGDSADSVFYLQSGRVGITVVSSAGKEATIAILPSKEFFGEESIVALPGFRLTTTTAIVPSSALKIERAEMIRVMSSEHVFSDLFLAFLLMRGMKTQANLVDHLFNSSEKRLARILLLMAQYDKPGEQEMTIPHITQETLADMVGTTRSRVSFFMNRFRELGYLSYDGEAIQVDKSLLKILLRD